MTHWAVPLVGKPYSARGRGPDAFDCWGLCVHVWRTHFGVSDIPDVAVDPARKRAVRERFAEAIEADEGHIIVAPFEGCAVLMSRARMPDHVGIYIAANGGGVLHAVENVGVVFTRIGALKANGLNIIGFYRPRGMQWPTSTSSAT